MTASVPSGTDQSRRASPADAVSPETPALVISTAKPLALSACSSLAGKAASAGKPSPAVSESPSATIRTGRSAAGSVPASGPASASAATTRANTWTRADQLPYDRGSPWPAATAGIIEHRNMHDTSRSGRTRPRDRPQRRQSIAGTGRGPCSYPQRHRPAYRTRRGDRPGRSVRLGQIHPAHGDGRAGARRHRLGHGRGRGARHLERGRAGALPRPQCRHRVPVVPSHPTMTALENVAVPLELAGIEDAQERAARELAAMGLGERQPPLSRPVVRRRAATRGACPRACAQSRHPHRRRADRQSRRDHGR